MQNTNVPFIGFLWLILSTSAGNCPDPALLRPTFIATHAVITAGIIPGLFLYRCTITRAAYKCEDSLVKHIPYEYDDRRGKIRRFSFLGDSLNFMFETDSHTYTIHLNETQQTYLITPSGDRIPSNRPCAKKLDKTAEVSNITISMTVSYAENLIYLLPSVFLTQTIINDCPYHSGYCYDDTDGQHYFWKVSTDLTEVKDYGFAHFADALVYRMTTTPLLQFLLLQQDLGYVAVELVKESSYSNHSIITRWQTDRQVNVSFHGSLIEFYSFKYTEIEVNISGSREDAFNRMRTRCYLQQLEQTFRADQDTFIFHNYIDYYFLIFVIYMGCSFLYAMFNVMVNYNTLRRLGGRRIKMIACATSHATTNRHLYQRQREGQDDLNAQLVMMSTKMDAQIKKLEYLTEIMETVLRRKKPEDTYDYVRISKYKGSFAPPEPLENKSHRVTAGEYDKWMSLTDIKSTLTNIDTPEETL